MTATPKRILFISSADKDHLTDINDKFVHNLNARAGGVYAAEWHNYDEFRLDFTTGHTKVTLQPSDEPLNVFAFVYFKSFIKHSEQAAVIATYLTVAGVPFVCSELREFIAMTKLTQFSKLAEAGLPIVPTLWLSHSKYLGQYAALCDYLGSPFIFKSAEGSGGNENFLITSEQQLANALTKHPKVSFVAQRFIPNDGDLRILIIGSQIMLIIHRRGLTGSHLNNTSKSGKATLVPMEKLAPEHRQLALKAAAVMKRETAGVDLMFDSQTGDPYILEVNPSPQIGSGAFTDEKLTTYSNYFKNMLK